MDCVWRSRLVRCLLQSLIILASVRYRCAGVSRHHSSVCHCDNSSTQCHIQGSLTLDRRVYARGSRLHATCSIPSSTSPCQLSPASISVQLSGQVLSREDSNYGNGTSASFLSESLTADENNATVTCYVDGYYQYEGSTDLNHIDVQRISVGVLPEKPHNISCIVMNMESMNCTWQPKQQDTGVPTTQTLYYKHEKNSPEAYIACRFQLGNMCFWRHRLLGQQAQIYQPYRYNMIVTAQNALGSVTSEERLVDTKKCVKLLPVQELACRVRTKSSLGLSWKLPVMRKYRETVICELRIWSPWEQDYVQTVLSNSSVVDFESVITDLTPHTQYTVLVRCITLPVYSSQRRQELWSDAARIVVSTEPDVPYVAPAVTPGGYRPLTDNQVQIFWQTLPRRQLNGRVNATRIQCFPRHNQSESPSCEGLATTLMVDSGRSSTILPLMREISFDVCVDVINQVGANDELVLQPIRIPDIVSQPAAPSFYAVGNSNNITVFLKEQSNMTYTLYWCSGIKAVCRNQNHQGYYWRAVTSSISWLNASWDRTILGLSAEYTDEWGHNISSGMSFAPYIFHSENSIQAPSMLRVVEQPDAVESVLLEWIKPSWQDTAYISHFIVTYCPKANCPRGRIMKVAVSGLLDRTPQLYTVTGLRGEERYVFTVYSLGRNQTSNSTEPVTATASSKGLRKKYVIVIAVTAVLLTLFLAAGIYTIVRYLRRKVKDYLSPFDVVIPEVTETYFNDEEPRVRYCHAAPGAQQALYWGQDACEEGAENDDTSDKVICPGDNNELGTQDECEADQDQAEASTASGEVEQASNIGVCEASGHSPVTRQSSVLSNYTRVARQASIASNRSSSVEATDGRYVPPTARPDPPPVQRTDSVISGNYVLADDSGRLLHRGNSCHGSESMASGAREEDAAERKEQSPCYQPLLPERHESVKSDTNRSQRHNITSDSHAYIEPLVFSVNS